MRLDRSLKRHMRKPAGADPPNSNYIGGLMQMYAFMNAWGKTGVEIGCYWGESAEIALHFLGHLYCVDPWDNPASEQEFDKRVGGDVRVTKIKKFSHVAADEFATRSVDIVYIDGAHDYDNVERDIMYWLPVLRPGGWIAGHDYDGMADHVGVVQAVDNLLGGPDACFPDSSWAVKKSIDP